jgi:hypothetical protein
MIEGVLIPGQVSLGLSMGQAYLSLSSNKVGKIRVF